MHVQCSRSSVQRRYRKKFRSRFAKKVSRVEPVSASNAWQARIPPPQVARPALLVRQEPLGCWLGPLQALLAQIAQQVHMEQEVRAFARHVPLAPSQL